MTLLYNLIFILFAIGYLPYLLFTGRYRYGMACRFGKLPSRINGIASNNKIIWIHAVSVGEAKAAGILAPFLRASFPQHRILFSTVTHTGNKVAKTIATEKEEVFYLPFDLSFITDRVVKTVKPEYFISLETELWPNLISSLAKFDTKIILVNGRISDGSYNGYRKIRFIISGIIRKYSLILVQSDMDKKRILDLGADEKKVFVTGNLKFDAIASGNEGDKKGIRDKLGINEKEILLIAGSTHAGEEEIIIECFSRLKKSYGNLRLLIAPRHIERTKEIEGTLTKFGFRPIRFSQINTNHEPRVFILDTIGDLKNVYSAGDIVFVGGSLVRKGGQNPIEPASFAKPIIIGPFTFNFRDVVKAFLENNSCIEVKNEGELYSAIKSLIDSPSQRQSLGSKAKEAIAKNSGSSQRTVDYIRSIGREPASHP